MAPPYTPPLSSLEGFADLCACLREEGVVHEADDGAHVVELTTCAGPLVGTMLIRWDWERPLVQIIQAMLVDVPDERLPVLDHAIARLNHAAPIAGYAIDHERRFVYYRTTVSRDWRGHLPVDRFAAALRTAVAAARDGLPILAPRERPEAPVACARA